MSVKQWPNVIAKTYKLIIRIILVTCLVLLASAGSFYAWIVTGPRPISYLNRSIEKSLNTYLVNYSFHISNTLLIWDEEQKSIDLRVTGVKIHNQKGQPIAAFPQLSIGISLADILHGQLTPSDLMVINPAFKLAFEGESSPDETRITVHDAYLGFVRELFTLSKTKLAGRSTNTIRIHNADLLFVRNNKEILLRINEGYITFLTSNNKFIATMELNTLFEGRDTKFSLLLEQQDDDTFLTHVSFKNLSSIAVKDIMPIPFFQQADVTGDGNVTVTLSKNPDTPPSINAFEVSKLAGMFSHPEYFKYPITINDMQANGHFINGISEMVIDNLTLKTDQPELSLKGAVKQENGQVKELSLAATAKNVPIDEIYRYWPEGLGPLPRQWVVSNIANGMVPNASIKLFLNEGDIASRSIPEEALEAKVAFTNASTDYFPLFPPAEKVEGTATFTGKMMEVNITKGKILGTNIQEGTVTIPDMHDHVRPVIIIKGKTEGPLTDGMAYFDKKPINALLQTSLESASGQAKSDINLVIPLIHPLTFDDLSININSALTEAALPSIFDKYDITGGTVNLAYNGKSIAFSGKALVNTVPVNLKIEQAFAKGAPLSGSYEFSASFDQQAATRLHIPSSDLMEGTTKGTIRITQKDKSKDIALDLDFTNAALHYPKLGWNKQAGEAATVSFTASDKGDGTFTIPSFNITSPTLQGRGSASISSDFSQLKSLTLDNFVFGQNNFSLNYTATPEASRLAITGQSLDLSQASFSQALSSSPDEKKPQTSAVTFRLGTVYLKNGETYTKMRGELYCRKLFCHTGQLHTMIPGGVLDMALSPVNTTKSHYIVSASDAGSVARAVDLYKTMKNGALNIDGYVTSQTGENGMPTVLIDGILKITNFTATKTPILAKIASLASLQGVADLLGNKGIQFKVLRAPFTMQDGIIRITDTKAHGSALGITAKGTINTKDQTLNLSGTFVPSYTVNNILSKIPLVGKLGEALMGGEGQGIIAARYKVKGTYEDAQVTVNPLSILTPGFLRNLFDVMDRSPKPPQHPKEEKKIAATTAPL